jgi:hypothetical protein
VALFVGILGALQILGGVAVYYWAPTSVQEILGAVMFGMGVLAFGMGCLIERADQQLSVLHTLKSRL